jgi:hypothetical protein
MAKLISPQTFAVSLVYVMYAYAGWNAATYIVGEMKSRSATCRWPSAMGTLLVAVLYLALNASSCVPRRCPSWPGRWMWATRGGFHLWRTGGKIMSAAHLPGPHFQHQRDDLGGAARDDGDGRGRENPRPAGAKNERRRAVGGDVCAAAIVIPAAHGQLQRC